MLPYRIRDYPSYNRIQLYFLCNHSGHTIHVNTWVFHRVSQIPATTGRPGYPSQPVQMPQLPHSETPVSVWREGHRVGSDRQADATVQERTKRKDSPAASPTGSRMEWVSGCASLGSCSSWPALASVLAGLVTPSPWGSRQGPLQRPPGTRRLAAQPRDRTRVGTAWYRTRYCASTVTARAVVLVKWVADLAARGSWGGDTTVCLRSSAPMGRRRRWIHRVGPK